MIIKVQCTFSPLSIGTKYIVSTVENKYVDKARALNTFYKVKVLAREDTYAGR